MKKKLLLLGILFVVFAAIIGFRFFIYDTQNSFGRIKVVSAPSAQVFVNNNLLGKTPFEDKLKVGDYLIKLIPEGSAGQTASVQVKASVYKNSLTYVNRELGDSDVNTAGEVFTITKMDKDPKQPDFGEIYIETDPNGAIVSLDNEEKGVAPIVLADVMKGNHELSVYMPGMLRRTQKINVDGGYRVNASFKLALDQSAQPTPTPIASDSATLIEDGKDATTSAKTKKTPTPTAKISPTTKPSASGSNKVTVKDTPTGFLRVRSDASVTASESAQVKPGDSFDVLEEKSGWYKIEYETGKTGWISGQYASKE